MKKLIFYFQLEDADLRVYNTDIMMKACGRRPRLLSPAASKPACENELLAGESYY